MRGEIVMERFLREMTFEEEYSFLQKEAKELFDKEDGKSDPPIANCIVRRALRCINKLLKEVEPYREYEDLEEQGLLLRLPCKVGDTVYEVQELRKRIQPYTIISIHVSKCGFLVGWEIKDGKGIYSCINGFCDDAIGKTVFLTKEEAEAKLKELEGE